MMSSNDPNGSPIELHHVGSSHKIDELGSTQSTLLGLQATVSNFARSFAQPYSQLLQSLERSNQMMESLNTLLESFVLNAIRARLIFGPTLDELQCSLCCQNESDLPIVNVSITITGVDPASSQTLLQLTDLTLLPKQVIQVPCALLHYLGGHVLIHLPSPGTQLPLTKQVCWDVPLPYTLRRSIEEAAPIHGRDVNCSATLTVALIRKLFGIPSTTSLDVGYSHAYRFAHPENSDSLVDMYLLSAVDHARVAVVSYDTNSSSLFHELESLDSL